MSMMNAGYNRSDFLIAGAAYLLLLVLFGAYLGYLGLRVVGDGNYYLAEARKLLSLIDEGGSYVSLPQYINFFYLGFISLLAVFIKLGGEQHWPVLMLMFSTAAYALCAPAVYLLYRRLGGGWRWPAAAAAVLLPMAEPDALILGPLLLRDVAQTGFSAAFLYLVIWVANQKLDLRRLVILAAACLLIIVMRASDIVVAVAALGLIFSAAYGRGQTSFSSLAVILFSFLTISLVLLAGMAHWFNDPSPFFPTILHDLLAQARIMHHKGVVIVDQTDTYLRGPTGFWGYLKLMLWKLVYYLRYWNPAQSYAHQLFRHAYFLGAVIMAAVFVKHLITLTDPARRIGLQIIFYWLIVLVDGAVLHAVLILPFEFRHQMLLMPPVWAMAIAGLEIAWNRFNPGKPRMKKHPSHAVMIWFLLIPASTAKI